VFAVGGHVVVVVALHLLETHFPRVGRGPTRVLGIVLMTLGVLGVLRYWSYGGVGMDPFSRTRWWLISLINLTYGIYLVWVRAGMGFASRVTGQATGASERRMIGSIVLAMLLTLFAFGSFEFTRAYAYEQALRQALRTEAAPWNFPLVRIYSRYDLALDDRLGIAERRLPGDPDAYRYSYEGLRMFAQHGELLVLWPAHRSPRSGMFVLKESADLRLEHEPELR
jgi:hypothetical protein